MTFLRFQEAFIGFKKKNKIRLLNEKAFQFPRKRKSLALYKKRVKFEGKVFLNVEIETQMDDR